MPTCSSHSLRIPVSLEWTPVDIHSLQRMEVASKVGRNPTMEVSMCLPKVGTSFFHYHHECRYANASKVLESTCLCHRHLHHNKHHWHGQIPWYKKGRGYATSLSCHELASTARHNLWVKGSWTRSTNTYKQAYITTNTKTWTYHLSIYNSASLIRIRPRCISINIDEIWEYILVPPPKSIY